MLFKLGSQRGYDGIGKEIIGVLFFVSVFQILVA